jgi:hypothetical protein
LDQSKLISSNLLPHKSKDRYELEYSMFCMWCNNKNITEVNDDDVMLVYMLELAKNLRPSSLWSKLSMIKTCLSLKENINIDSFPKTSKTTACKETKHWLQT